MFGGKLPEGYLSVRGYCSGGQLSGENCSGGNSPVTGNCTETASLAKLSSIFTAETHALHLALNTISATKRKNFFIFTDSRSYLQALQKQITTYPKVRNLKHTIANLQKLGITVELCWIPGHAGIAGNNITEKKAEEASRRLEEKMPCPYQMFKACFHILIMPYMGNEKLWNEMDNSIKELDLGRMKLLPTDSELAIHH